MGYEAWVRCCFVFNSITRFQEEIINSKGGLISGNYRFPVNHTFFCMPADASLQVARAVEITNALSLQTYGPVHSLHIYFTPMGRPAMDTLQLYCDRTQQCLLQSVGSTDDYARECLSLTQCVFFVRVCLCSREFSLLLILFSRFVCVCVPLS